MNPRYQAYLEEVEERKRQGLPPPPYVVTPDGKMSFERFRPGQDLGMVDPTHHSGGVRLNAPGPLNIPSQAEQTFVKKQPVIRPSAQHLDPAGFGAAEKRGIEGAADFVYWNNFNSPTKKKTVITQEDGKPTKKVVTETEDTEGERSQYDIMLEQARDHAAGNTTSLPNIPGISDVEAGRTSQPSPEKEGTELWYWLDDMIRRRKEREEATDKQFPPNKWNMPYNPEDVGIPGHPFETTAEREERLRGAVAEAAWDQDEADRVGVADILDQARTGQMGSGETLPGSAA